MDYVSTLTLEALKDVLSTYGVNNDERTMPVTVRVTDPNKVGFNETFYVVTEAEIAYDGWPQVGQVLLQAVPDTEGT